MFGFGFGVNRENSGWGANDARASQPTLCASAFLGHVRNGVGRRTGTAADTPQLFALADKVVHTLAFAALTLVGLRAYPRLVFVVCILLVVLGGLKEIVQGYTSTGAQNWEDFFADILGVDLGTLLAKLFRFTD